MNIVTKTKQENIEFLSSTGISLTRRGSGVRYRKPLYQVSVGAKVEKFNLWPEMRENHQLIILLGVWEL